jgi:hypothetical protein
MYKVQWLIPWRSLPLTTARNCELTCATLDGSALTSQGHVDPLDLQCATGRDSQSCQVLQHRSPGHLSGGQLSGALARGQGRAPVSRAPLIHRNAAAQDTHGAAQQTLSKPTIEEASSQQRTQPSSENKGVQLCDLVPLASRHTNGAKQHRPEGLVPDTQHPRISGCVCPARSCPQASSRL